MRVHELAKSLKISSKELLEKLHQLGVKAASHMSNLDEKTTALLKEKKPKKETAAPRTPAHPVVPPPSQSKPSVGKRAPVAAPFPPPMPRAPLSEEKPAVSTATPSREAIEEEEGEKKEISVEELPPPAKVAESIPVEVPLTVGAFASRLGVKIPELIKALMAMGVLANVNQLLGEEVVFKVAAQLGIPIQKAFEEDEKLRSRSLGEAEDEKLAKPRPPVVTLMGHVDHGKTSLLDAIRKSNVAAREAGQITQHIGAYVVDIPEKGHVIFLDTPGHEAFTAMRARGANVTDIVVLVVAADDGVMPQTVEAIDHAREADAPIVVAVNKCDLPQANPQKAMMQLQKIGLVSEEWGGKTIFCKISAKTGEGIDHLLEMLLLEAEVLELKANPDRAPEGTVIEGRLTKGSGPVATVIVRKGTLRMGQIVIAGPHYGRIRALRNDRGKSIREAGPAYAVEVHGLNGVPDAGEIFQVVEDEKAARRLAEKRMLEIRERQTKGAPRHLTLETLHERIEAGGLKELKVIIKADVQGSVEALTQSLEKIPAEKVGLHVIHGGVGGVNESDVMLAAASDAVLLGFHVKAEPRAEQLAEREGVDIRLYNVIYKVVEDVQKAMEGLLEPVLHEIVEGRAEVRRIFRSSKAGTVGGGMITKGKITRSSNVRLIRNQVVVFEGRLASLRHFKDDVREVLEGYEFGFGLEGHEDLRERDLLEAYRLEKTK